MRVRNADDETLRNVAVTVETQAGGRNAPRSRSARATRGPAWPTRTRPIWVLDEGPKGGDTAYVNTWLGRARCGPARSAS